MAGPARPMLSDWLRPDACARAAPMVRAALAPGAIQVTGQQIDMRVTDDEIARVYAPVAVVATDLALAAPRALVAVAGPPGSGKSVFAMLLAKAVAALDAADRVCPQCLGLDGFHYPNRVLDSRRVPDEQGRPVPMRLYKGAEFTYDAAAANAKFREIKQTTDRAVAAPAYDRRRHEPVADAVVAPASCRLVIVEGNYLLLDEGEWQGMAEVFDLSIYIDMAAADCKPGLIARHCRGGRNPADAEQHYARVDLRNHRVIEATRQCADLVVRKAAGHRVAAVFVQRPQRLAAAMSQDVRRRGA